MNKNYIIWPVKIKIDEKAVTILIIGAWLIVNVLVYLTFGLQTGLESKKYIQQAEELYQNGEVSQLRYYFYFSIIFLLYISKIIGQDIYFAVCVQLAISLIAHVYFYKSLRDYGMIGLKKAVLATILVLVAPSFEYWNFTLYSESLFFSLILFFLGACIRHKPTTIRNIGLQLLILMGCVISRPMGILLVIPWIFYVSASNSKKFSWKIIISSFAIGLLPLIIISNSILGTIGDWNVLDPFYKGYIICGIPSNTSLNQFPTQAKTPIGQLIELLINNPNLLISLSIKKIIAFFFQCRSYYSLPHNFYIIIYTATTMSLFFYSLFKHGTKQPILKMSLMIIFFWTISIILQCDDYHSRFYSAIIPLISIVCVGIKGNLMK